MKTAVIAEDHALVRKGIRLLLEKANLFASISEADDGAEALRIVRKLKPDVLLVDLSLPKLHGLELISLARVDSPQTRCIVVSVHSDTPYLMEAFRNGAAGYVLKDASPDELNEAIKIVIAGGTYVTQRLRQFAIRTSVGITADATGYFQDLTSRERLVLQLAAEGQSCPDIAARLSISPRTAETHRANVMHKLGLKTQTDLVRFAIRKGLIPV